MAFDVHGRVDQSTRTPIAVSVLVIAFGVWHERFFGLNAWACSGSVGIHLQDDDCDRLAPYRLVLRAVAWNVRRNPGCLQQPRLRLSGSFFSRGRKRSG